MTGCNFFELLVEDLFLFRSQTLGRTSFHVRRSFFSGDESPKGKGKGTFCSSLAPPSQGKRFVFCNSDSLSIQEISVTVAVPAAPCLSLSSDWVRTVNLMCSSNALIWIVWIWLFQSGGFKHLRSQGNQVSQAIIPLISLLATTPFSLFHFAPNTWVDQALGDLRRGSRHVQSRHQ